MKIDCRMGVYFVLLAALALSTYAACDLTSYVCWRNTDEVSQEALNKLKPEQISGSNIAPEDIRKKFLDPAIAKSASGYYVPKTPTEVAAVLKATGLSADVPQPIDAIKFENGKYIVSASDDLEIKVPEDGLPKSAGVVTISTEKRQIRSLTGPWITVSEPVVKTEGDRTVLFGAVEFGSKGEVLVNPIDELAALREKRPNGVEVTVTSDNILCSSKDCPPAINSIVNYPEGQRHWGGVGQMIVYVRKGFADVDVKGGFPDGLVVEHRERPEFNVFGVTGSYESSWSGPPSVLTFTDRSGVRQQIQLPQYHDWTWQVLETIGSIDVWGGGGHPYDTRGGAKYIVNDRITGKAVEPLTDEFSSEGTVLLTQSDKTVIKQGPKNIYQIEYCDGNSEDSQCTEQTVGRIHFQ